MFINKIKLRNYRIYKDDCEIIFPHDEFRNVYIVSGNNGFGKTTLLTSLVWCFYGKNIIDVEKKYREEIYDSGGYRKYAKSCLNVFSKSQGIDEYSVSVTISDLFIPSIPCDKIEIVRSYNIVNEQERLLILIDGAENELTKEVGNEIFINDFILPKEIAKFFFFDAEKIVALAEITSLEEKQALSRAYSEVLGIKKYEDLKSNLQDLRTRLKRTKGQDDLTGKLNLLYKELESQKELLKLHESKIENLREELDSKKSYSEQLQERLIREGNALSIDEVQNLRLEIKSLSIEAENLKSEINDHIDLIPFAICRGMLNKVMEQIKKETDISLSIPSELKSRLITNIKKLSREKIHKSIIAKVLGTIENTLNSEGNTQNKIKLLELDDTTKNQIAIVHNKLQYSFSTTFNELSKRYKNNRLVYFKAVRNLSDAEARERDLLIKEVRIEKSETDERIHEIYLAIASVEMENQAIKNDIANKQRQISEIEKIVKLSEMDLRKDETSKRLINGIQGFINKLRLEKKHSLELNIKLELNKLMHKKDFVSKVEVALASDIIDIQLFRKTGEVIEKEKLSKGEQQLYATALLKSLVNESNIKFPVFIDSPLQKFDKIHSDKVINEFYPSISEQVVLFPLLEKELSEKEYQKLNRKVASAYLIKNTGGEYSYFQNVEPKKLFTSYTLEYDTDK